ncbi:hypothetical protein EPA93_02405 [Ktedonosporobacter rubrisoli]|uniref:Transmembrane protein n=1 Tax=Ktedonosporobacter rubrisoli TaxID=2509675 RepID=A0A4P6JIS6_KTERU|nr:hypothetical protein [Ktedonosporobacter rubrisoli]QBD74903.1 hypothetical protein EPA93_02405 [Ktedonosporobacter rubrisoli]
MNKSARNPHLKAFWIAAIVYVIVMFISAIVVNISPSSAWWRIPLALTPIVPAIFAMFTFIRFIGHMDEMQRHIQLEGLAFAFASTGLLTFSYGFLENIGFPHLGWLYVFPLMMVLWSIGTDLASWRYR